MREALLHAPLLLCVATLVVAAAASLLPVSPLEPLLLAVAASVPAHLVLPVIVLATVGHMAAKTIVYLGSRHTERAVPASRLAALQRVRALASRSRPTQVVIVLVSGLVGTPPFYLVTVCCGALRLPLCDYLVAGGVGRGLRFAALAVLPRLVSAS